MDEHANCPVLSDPPCCRHPSCRGRAFSPAFAGTVSGIVTDHNGGAPLAGVPVRAILREPPSQAPRLVDSDITDNAGRYTLDIPFAGRLAVVTASSVYVNRNQDGAQCVSQSTCDAQTQPWAWIAASHETVHFALARGARIAGRITDRANGAPVAGATVVVHRHGDSSSTASTTSAADGSYAIGALVGAQYRVWSDAQGTDSPWTNGYVRRYYPDFDCDDFHIACTDPPAGVTVPSGEEVTNVDVSLRRGVYMRGRAVDAMAGTAVPDAEMVAFVADQPTRYRTSEWRSPDGRPVLGPVLPGPVKLLMRSGSPVDYRAAFHLGEPCDEPACQPASAPTVVIPDLPLVDNLDATLTPLRSIHGRLVQADDGQPIAGVRVVAGRIADEPWSLSTWGFQPVSTAVSNADGDFVLTGFQGASRVIVRTLAGAARWIDRATVNVACTPANRFCNEAATAGEFGDIALDLQPHSGPVEFRLTESGAISGRILERATGLGLSGATALVLDVATQRVLKTTRTTTDGTYHIGGLTSGRYLVMAADWAADWRQAQIHPTAQCFLETLTTPAVCTAGESRPITVLGTQAVTGIDIAVNAADEIFRAGFEMPR
ncbi:carboxypeptidase-like regulatory domain-containing protein [Tahibacter amnicola]|uniref:Carboxypeptidase-like regulatory domain-containing protein n=1 Tax=Tahibacter amnicola TaxID=2976241 RepID=A0ABY6BIW5_9GAMM|nr:carboxypeptidase-like regulatory domain-containing protein [Tahibacter amnicola]UXI69313.1 carboxypeptidase-like regulatory domain-containing protein [Tahibacter amnicola]